MATEDSLAITCGEKRSTLISEMSQTTKRKVDICLTFGKLYEDVSSQRNAMCA